MPLSPPKKRVEPMVVLTCQVPPDIVKAILAEAQREERTRSDVVRRIFKSHFADKAVTV